MENTTQHHKETCKEENKTMLDELELTEHAISLSQTSLAEDWIDGNKLLTDLLICEQEIISSPLRFNGVSVDNIKIIFEKHGIKYKQPF